MADIGSDQILLNLLEKVATQQKFVKYDVKVQPVSSNGANYTSKLFYDVERIAYTKLASIYDVLEKKHEVPENNRSVFPKYYGFNSIKYKEAIVLENLSSAGYAMYDRLVSIDWGFAARAVEELAKLHALSFAFEAEYPEEFQETLQEIKRDITDDNQMKAYWNHIVNTALNATKEENKEKLKKFLSKGKLEVLVKHFTPRRRTAITHNDYRVSNLMQKTNDDGSIDIKIVDLQTLQAGSPVADLLYFIFTGSDQQFRAVHYERLVEHYYTQLSAAMARLRLQPDQIYSREDFYSELKDKLPFGLSIAVFTLPVITVEAQNAPKVDENMEISSFSVQNTSDLYTERLNGIVDDYVKWGILK